jgi:alpha-L-fucosidase 2
LVFGGIDREVLQINEDSIWKKSYVNSTINPASADSANCVDAVRGLLAQNQYDRAEKLADCLMGHPDGSAAPASIGSLLSPYQPLMDLAIDFTGAPVTNYTRGLNLSSGIAHVSYDSSLQPGTAHATTTFRRAVFAPAQDNVLVMHLQKNGSQKISLSITLNRTGTDNDQAAVSVSTAAKQLDLSGRLNHPDGSSYLMFVGSVRAIAEGAGASVSSTGGGGGGANPATIHVSGADAVTLLIGAASNFDAPALEPKDIQQVVQRTLDAAQKKGVAALAADHVAAFSEIARRASVSFGAGGAPPAAAALPTDQRVAAARAHGADSDPGLLPLMFRLGRCLLASSSNPASGSHPANLQGVWNAAMSPPWNSEYTTNINLEMNYWPAEVTALQDMTPPLVAFVKRLAVSGGATAAALYNVTSGGAWCQHHDTTVRDSESLTPGTRAHH